MYDPSSPSFLRGVPAVAIRAAARPLRILALHRRLSPALSRSTDA